MSKIDGCYDETNVLVNKKNIKDEEKLKYTSLQTTQIYLHSSKVFLMEQHKKNDKFSKLNLKL